MKITKKRFFLSLAVIGVLLLAYSIYSKNITFGIFSPPFLLLGFGFYIITQDIEEVEDH